MSAASEPDRPPGQPGSADPSMEDILASIRRILNEDPTGGAEADEPPPLSGAREAPRDVPLEQPRDVLVLDEGMMTPAAPEPEPDPPAAKAMPEPIPPPMPPPVPPSYEPEGGLIAPETAQAASESLSQLASALASQRLALVHRGGPTLEDLVREELRPLLKAWLDNNLPPLVERLVRAELDRLGVGRVG